MLGLLGSGQLRPSALQQYSIATPAHLATVEVAICQKGKKDWVSGLRSQIDIVHKQRVNARLAECDDRVGGRADDWLAVIEGRIDDERHAGSRKETGYELVKARI